MREGGGEFFEKHFQDSIASISSDQGMGVQQVGNGIRTEKPCVRRCALIPVWAAKEEYMQ